MTDEEMRALLYDSDDSLNEHDAEIKAYIEGLLDRIAELESAKTSSNMVTITRENAQMILDALDVSLDNIELDLLNDEEDEFADMYAQVTLSRDFLAMFVKED
jgi:hypothetical protein